MTGNTMCKILTHSKSYPCLPILSLLVPFLHVAGGCKLKAWKPGTHNPRLSITPCEWFSSDLISQRMCGRVWRHFWSLQLAVGRCYCHLVIRCCWIDPILHRMAPQQRITQPNVSVVPRLRNPALYWDQWAECGERVSTPLHVSTFCMVNRKL